MYTYKRINGYLMVTIEHKDDFSNVFVNEENTSKQIMFESSCSSIITMRDPIRFHGHDLFFDELKQLGTNLKQCFTNQCMI